MCYGCYMEYGEPRIVNEDTLPSASLIDNVYDYSDNGGNAHIVVDDWNLEDSHIEFCIDQIARNPFDSPQEQLDAELWCLEKMLSLSMAERASAMAIHEGWLSNELKGND
jgi:hypothetical protein